MLPRHWVLPSCAAPHLPRQAFTLVEGPLNSVEKKLRTFNGTKYMTAVNYFTDINANDATCPYDTQYTWATAAAPWNQNSGTSSWGVSYARSGTETPRTYMHRVFASASCSTYNDDLFDAWETAYNYVSPDESLAKFCRP